MPACLLRKTLYLINLKLPTRASKTLGSFVSIFRLCVLSAALVGVILAQVSQSLTLSALSFLPTCNPW